MIPNSQKLETIIQEDSDNRIEDHEQQSYGEYDNSESLVNFTRSYTRRFIASTPPHQGNYIFLIRDLHAIRAETKSYSTLQIMINAALDNLTTEERPSGRTQITDPHFPISHSF